MTAYNALSPQTEAAVIVTEKAAAKVKSLLDEEASGQSMMLRVYISGGGCSGFQYNFIFEKNIADVDQVISTCFADVNFVVDPMSLSYLKGAEIDYEEGLHGSQFVIRNPNAKTTCGCGSSFDV